jgi:Fe-S oxidoreductase
VLTFVDEYPALTGGRLREQARAIAENSWTIDAFLEQEGGALQFAEADQRVIVHGHCHQKALTGMAPLMALLERIPGARGELLDTSCCGMAGSFGYEQEHYEISRRCAERVLAPTVRAADADDIVLAPGFSCRHQIEHFADRQPLHPVRYLEMRLKREEA